jgi:hypothetical protein
VLRPHFLLPGDYARIATATSLVLSALHRLFAALRPRRDYLIRRLALTEAEQLLLDLDEGYGMPDVSTRMDAFWHPADPAGPGRLHFLEYNAESPGGIAYGEALAGIFADLEPSRRFGTEYRVSCPPLRTRVYDTLIDCYVEWCRSRDLPPRGSPSIAIVDWREARTRREFELSAETFRAAGSKVVIVDPAELAYAGGRLWAGEGFAVDLVYKRVVVQELIDRCGSAAAFAAHPLVRASLDGAVCVANGLSVQLLFSKAWFALLWEPDFAQLLTAEELEAVRSCVPWTGVVTEGPVDLDGGSVELLEHLRRHREGFVLKPAKDYGGHGVVLGWETTEADWDTALATALASPHVAQARVAAPRATFPVWNDTGLSFEERLVDVDPYVWRGGSVFHAGARLGEGAILNVSAGGGSATPVWLVEAL